MVSFATAFQKVLRRFGVASVPRTQWEIQRFHTGVSGEFGQPISASDITKVIKRLPVAHRIVFAVAHDIFDNWFRVEPLGEDVDGEKFNEQVQKALLLLNAKDVFTQASVFERAYGWSIIVLGYQDKGLTLKDPVLMPEKIVSLEAYAPTMITGVETDKNRQSQRFGLPETNKIKIVENEEVEVQHTRVIHFATRLLDHPWKDISALEPVWDDLTVLQTFAGAWDKPCTATAAASQS